MEASTQSDILCEDVGVQTDTCEEVEEVAQLRAVVQEVLGTLQLSDEEVKSAISGPVSFEPERECSPVPEKSVQASDVPALTDAPAWVVGYENGCKRNGSG